MPILKGMQAKWVQGAEDADARCQAILTSRGQEEGWQKWFAAREHFRHEGGVESEIVATYGYLARDVADAKSWRELGYRVREEAAGMRVGQETYYRESEVRGQAGAQAIWIEGAAVPEGEGGAGEVEGIEAALEEAGWRVRWEASAKGEKALTCHDEKTIYVLPGKSALETLNRLGHEVGHALLHTYGAQKGKKWEMEVEAQIFAFKLAERLGHDISDYSCTYIFGWSEGRTIQHLLEGKKMTEVLNEVETVVVSKQADELGVV